MKIPFAGIELTSQRVRGCMDTSELPGRPTILIYWLNYHIIRGHKVENTIRKGKRTTYSPYDTKRKTVNAEKAISPKRGKKGKKGKKEHVWLSGAIHIEERRMIGRRAAASFSEKSKKTKTKQKQRKQRNTRKKRTDI